MKIKYSRFFFAASLNLILFQLAIGDGCFVSNNYDRDVFAPDQKVAISWDGSTETMILATKLQAGTIADFGWLIPIKATKQPEVTLGDMQVFYDLSDYFKSMREEIESQNARSASLSLDSEDVEVLEKKKLDVYDITVLKANEGKALAEWLKKNDFKLPKDGNETLNSYANENFFFIAVKLDLTNKYKAEISELGNNIKLIESVRNKVRKTDEAEKHVPDVVRAVINRKEYVYPIFEYIDEKEYERLKKIYTGEANSINESSRSIETICKVITDLKSGLATPLKISFKTDNPSFPLKISSINKGRVTITAYVLSNEPLTDKTGVLKIQKCIQTTAGFKSKINKYLPVSSSEWVAQLTFDGNSSDFKRDADFVQADQNSISKTEDKAEELYRAIRDGDIDKTKVLLKYFPNINHEILICSPLEYAVTSKQVKIAEYLISKGAQVNPMNFNQEFSVLTAAVMAEDINMIKLLVEKGANIDQSKALNFAAMGHNVEITRFLLKHGASANSMYAGSTALHEAIENGEIEIMKLLLENGANVNAKDELGETPLYSLMHIPYDNETPRLLLEYGADPNTSSKGKPLLSELAEVQNAEFAEMLIKKGADVNRKDINGDSALQIAIRNNNQVMINLLKKYGAK